MGIGLRYFSKEDIRMANEHMKRSLTSLVIKEMKIKITKRHHLTPTRIAIIKTKNQTNKNMLVRVWRNWNPCTLLVGM